MWDMHPNGTRVVVDPETRDGRSLAEWLAKKGLNPRTTIMTVVENKMVKDPNADSFFERKVPHIIVALPDHSRVETEPVALNRAL